MNWLRIASGIALLVACAVIQFLRGEDTRQDIQIANYKKQIESVCRVGNDMDIETLKEGTEPELSIDCDRVNNEQVIHFMRRTKHANTFTHKVIAPDGAITNK